MAEAPALAARPAAPAADMNELALTVTTRMRGDRPSDEAMRGITKEHLVRMGSNPTRAQVDPRCNRPKPLKPTG